MNISEKFEKTMEEAEKLLCQLRITNAKAALKDAIATVKAAQNEKTIDEKVAEQVNDMMVRMSVSYGFSQSPLNTVHKWSHSDAVKPPIGVVNKSTWIGIRKIELAGAITRYSQDGLVPPFEWCLELEEYLKG